jgi:hypothetical protein
MPVSPDDAVSLAKGMLDLYAGAELRLLELIGQAVADGIDTPHWRERQLLAVQRMRAQTKRLLADLEAAATQEAQAAILQAYNRGAGLAGLDVSGTGAAAFGGVDAGAVSALTSATAGQLASTGLLIASTQEAIYRDVVSQVAGQMLTDGINRRQASARAMQTWADRGVTAFTDRAGRAWTMSAYAEMTMRTVVAQAAVQGHVDRLTDAGRDLVMVSDAPEECEMCRPWEGKVLTVSGQPGDRSEDGYSFTVAGTLAQARAAGLFHPNCRHRLVQYIPGITRPLLDTEDPEGDRLRQTQRYKERRIRQLKRRQVTARATGDQAAISKTTGQLRAAQREFKEWRDQNGRKDLNYRTSIKTPVARPQPETPAKRKRTPRTPPPDVIDWNTRELRAASDDDLADALGRAYEADHPNTNRIEAELDRRDSAPYREQERREKRNEAARAKRAADREAQHDEVSRLIGQGWDPRDAVATVTGVSVEKQLRTELTMRLRAEGTPGQTLDEMIGHRFEQERARRYVDAEDFTRGHMLTPEGEAKGIDPYALFHGPEKRARRWASPELKEWWDQNGRLTRDDYRQQLLTGGLGLGERVDDFLT